MEWRWKMERGTDWNGAGGWLMNRSSRMRVIIMTDVVYSHFPLASFILWRWKTHPLFLWVTDECYGAMPSHVIISPFPLTLEAFILPLASLFPPSFTSILRPSGFSLFAFFSTFCSFFVSACVPPSSLFLFFCFHYCRVDMAVCDCCYWVEHM